MLAVIDMTIQVAPVMIGFQSAQGPSRLWDVHEFLMSMSDCYTSCVIASLCRLEKSTLDVPPTR